MSQLQIKSETSNPKPTTIRADKVQPGDIVRNLTALGYGDLLIKVSDSTQKSLQDSNLEWDDNLPTRKDIVFYCLSDNRLCVLPPQQKLTPVLSARLYVKELP